MIVSENLLSNPSGEEGFTGWSTTGTVTINGGFILAANSSISQQYTVDPLPDPLPTKYRIAVSYINSVVQPRTIANFSKSIFAYLYYEDGTVGYVQTPLRLDVVTPDHLALDWYHVSGEIELDTIKVIDYIVVSINIGTITGTVTVKDVYLVSLTEESGISNEEVEEIIEQSIYEGALSSLNELAANAQGFYVTNDRDPITGSIIYYQHDEPSLVDSMLVYKMSAEGFFWTDQGWAGEETTWTSGYTAAGNIVGKTLSVLGLNADWIIAGVIKDTNGYTSINIEDGTFSFADGDLTYDPINGLYAQYLHIHPGDSTEDITFQVEGRAAFDDTTYHYAYAIPIEAESGAKPYLGDENNHWGALYVDEIYCTGAFNWSGIYIQNDEPAVPAETSIFVDTNDYSRYDVLSVTTSCSIALDDPEVILGSNSINITLHTNTYAGIVKKIYNIGSGTLTIKDAGGSTLTTIAAGNVGKEFLTTGSGWVWI